MEKREDITPEQTDDEPNYDAAGFLSLFRTDQLQGNTGDYEIVIEYKNNDADIIFQTDQYLRDFLN